MAQPGRIIIKNIDAAAGYRSRLHLKQTHEDVDSRRFSSAGRSHNTHGFPYRHAHTGIIQDFFRSIGI